MYVSAFSLVKIPSHIFKRLFSKPVPAPNVGYIDSSEVDFITRTENTAGYVTMNINYRSGNILRIRYSDINAFDAALLKIVPK